MIRPKSFSRLLMLSIGLLTTAMSVEAKEIIKLDNRIYNCEHLIKENERIGVLLILGDSNIAASDVQPKAALPAVFNVNPINGLCYPANEPLMGTVAKPGSPWIRLADKLVEEKVYDKVLLVPVMLPQSNIADWKQDGRVFPRLENAIRTLPEQRITINSVLWQQGQKNDSLLTKKEDYIAGFADVVTGLRKDGVNVPIYVAKTGDCPGKASGIVWDAQASLPGHDENVLAGPDLSGFGSDHFDGPKCALNQKGLDAYVQSWFDVLVKK